MQSKKETSVMICKTLKPHIGLKIARRQHIKCWNGDVLNYILVCNLMQTWFKNVGTGSCLPICYITSSFKNTVRVWDVEISCLIWDFSCTTPLGLLYYILCFIPHQTISIGIKSGLCKYTVMLLVLKRRTVGTARPSLTEPNPQLPSHLCTRPAVFLGMHNLLKVPRTWKESGVPCSVCFSWMGVLSDSPQSPDQLGIFQQTGVDWQSQLAFCHGQLAVFKWIVGDWDSQGPEQSAEKMGHQDKQFNTNFVEAWKANVATRTVS